MTLQRYHIAHDGSHVSCIYCSDACVFKHETGEWVKASEAEAALKEKDAEITALKKRIEEMKCCGNCNQGRPDKEECAIFCKRDGSGNLDRWEARG